MPKLKTHKGAKKRFRITASGKLKRKRAGKKHLNSHKAALRKMHLRRPLTMDDKLAKKIVLAMEHG
jgi:large subunit ribosomal protein L35